MNITASDMHFKKLNSIIKNSEDDNIVINECMGQRYIASGLSGKTITINGIPGNALGAYFDGGEIVVNGNVQDAVGDTMNEGKIAVYGSAGDAAGYAMRGGSIFVKENTGYRAGIHMKAYRQKEPSIVIGGSAGSFLGEYQAGGNIVVLGLNTDKCPVGRFCGTGMHGGRIYLRTEQPPLDLPRQVSIKKAEAEDLKHIERLIKEFCSIFLVSEREIMSKGFYLLTPNSSTPYKQLYTPN